ncbi:LysM peptidoglycan-binding domain-containing M23 family metallopeptidase [Skermanella stibiiresistens]|nr:LysM peptidoglycan-binding domain-containing M23 family metallopeptidase [Skermanella stibiiresistens]
MGKTNLAIVMVASALAVTSCARRDAPAPVSIYQEQPVPSAPGMVTVARGDSVSEIATRYGVPVRDVIDLNNLKPPYALAVGQRLRLPTARFHTVRKGDTMLGISRMYQVGMSDLARNNGLQEPYAIKIGQQLRLPGGGDAPTLVAENATGQQRNAMSARSVPEAAPRPAVSTQELAPPVVTQAPSDSFVPPPGYGIARSGSMSAPVATQAPSAPQVVVEQPAAVQEPSRQVAALAPPPASVQVPRPVPRVPSKPALAPPPPDTVERTVAATIPEAAPPVVAAPAPVVATKPPAVDLVEPRSSGQFQWPVRGTILSEFGPKPGGLHNDGLNISAAKGSSVVAAENGVVAYAGNELRGFGNLLLIRHADGWVSAYAHLDDMMVDRGAKVKRGQKIGTVGSTGNVSAPQLHFELRKANRAIDPRDYLSGEKRVSRDVSRDGQPDPG